MSYDKAIMEDIARRRKIYEKIKDKVYWSAIRLSEQERSHISMSVIQGLEQHYKLTPLSKSKGQS